MAKASSIHNTLKISFIYIHYLIGNIVDIVQKIKEKKELSGLPDDLVKSTLNEYLSKNKISNINLDKNKKLIIKEVRSRLRRYTGQYASSKNIKNREKLLKDNNFSEILKQHASTRERIEDYQLVRSFINKINPKSILDLGCGLNPIAIASPDIKFHAYDINDNDLEIVKQFFTINKISGDIHHKDITKVTNYPKVDLCIIFKVLDILENRTKVSKHLLENIDSKFFLISFATKTLTGKPMSSPYRRWFEKILNNLKYSYEVKRTSQELFYIIRKA